MMTNTRGRPAPPAPGHGTGLRPGRSAAPPTAGQHGRPAPGRPAGGMARKSKLFAAGAAVTAIPAAPGLAYAAGGHPQAVPLLISSAVIGLTSIITGAVVKIHGSAQRTRREQIQQAGPTAIAEAMARCIDDAHTSAPDVPADQHAAEAAAVRTAAAKAITEMMPAMLAAFAPRGPEQADPGAASPGQHPARP